MQAANLDSITTNRIPGSVTYSTSLSVRSVLQFHLALCRSLLGFIY